MLLRDKRDEIASHILAFYNFEGHIVKHVTPWNIEDLDVWDCSVILEVTKEKERTVPFWVKFKADSLEVEYVKVEQI